ncbi:hypothetical protein IAT40_006544 [Kwoniella sp. CBS 6097]
MSSDNHVPDDMDVDMTDAPTDTTQTSTQNRNQTQTSAAASWTSDHHQSEPWGSSFGASTEAGDIEVRSATINSAAGTTTTSIGGNTAIDAGSASEEGEHEIDPEELLARIRYNRANKMEIDSNHILKQVRQSKRRPSSSRTSQTGRSSNSGGIKKSSHKSK